MADEVYAVRSDIKSQDDEYKDKLMSERAFAHFFRAGWKRETTCKLKYKRECILTSPNGNKIINHVMENERTDTGNFFLNWDKYHDYDNITNYDVLITAVEYNKTNPRYIWFSELQKMNLQVSKGTTLGYLVPKDKTYELNALSVKEIEQRTSTIRA